MQLNANAVKFFVGILVISLFNGCATSSQKEPAPKLATQPTVVVTPSFDAMMKQASDYISAGQTENALVQLKSAAKAYPANIEPWQKMAQIKFDNASYSEAIVFAEQALIRDPADQLGNSIVAVGGLRLSTNALATLRGRNSLNGSVKAEALSLATLLRESLGTTVLVPPVRKPAKSTRKTSLPSSSNTPKDVPDAKVSASQNSSADSSDPFNSLK